ncbi:lipase [Photobacterium sp. SDRW27]|uniref:VolA/Pla-1 family phospholipase n=1 Tax=Photobacterium obscurum TaxID=2829490 RepID=UPI002243F8EE|nr:VolA/Pla-1 family phospholipase [Photobacterium obscurum]MCW8328354.1 lipase [Photobacterium obscurum]
MKKNLLAVLIASSIGLYGCGNESELTGNPTIDPGIEKSLKAETKIKFDLISDPTNPVIVSPTFLAMDSTDGTLKSDGVTGDEGYNDISDPAVAMGKTDGWSTTQPFIIEFTGNDLDENTATDGFYLIESNDPTAGTPTIIPKPLTAANGDFTFSVSGTTLTVVLLKPLKPASNYMFAITDELKDVKGNSVGMTGSYATLKATAKPPSDALIPAQVVVHATEKELDTAGVDADSIIFSSWFTTASVGDVLYAAKSATALALAKGANDVWKGSAISDSVTEEQLSSLFTLVPPEADEDQPKTLGGNNIYTGTVNLPYFLEVAPTKFSVTPWQSGMPSLAKISDALSNGSDADKATIAQQLGALGITTDDLAEVSTNPETQVKVLSALTGATLTLADGSQLDPERTITRYSPVPKLKSVQEVEYTLILPSAAKCAAPNSNTVSIYQHGITSSKESIKVTTLADQIIGTECHAVFAIDHPLHGTRGIEGVGSATGDDGRPEMYLNLSALPVARDNLRQSAIDLVNLRVGIGKVFATLASQDPAAIGQLGKLMTLKPSEGVGFVGHSLGAMTGVNLGYLANKSVGDTQADMAFFNINKFGLANPGAGIPYLLLESESFGDFVKSGVIGGYTDEEDAPLKIGDLFRSYCKDNAIANPAACYISYEDSLIDAGDPLSTAQLKATYDLFSQFAYAAQSVLDTVDPINHSTLVNTTLPVYLAQVKGDKTIPNQLIPGATVEGTEIAKPYSPFGGTLPLLKTMSLAPVTEDVSGVTVRNAVLFNEGEHSSLLDPTESLPVTAEMQTQIPSLLNSDGTTLAVDNSQNIIDARP